MSKTIKAQIWTLYYEGYSVYEIAEALDLAEYDVIRILQPKGY